MNRRQFIDRLLYTTGGIILANQLELIEKLTPKDYVSGFDFATKKDFTALTTIYVDKEYSLGFIISRKMIEDDWWYNKDYMELKNLSDKMFGERHIKLITT